MNHRIRFGAYAAFFSVIAIAACSSEDVSDAESCSPATTRDCDCSETESGTQICNSTGSGYTNCVCSGGGDGGSGGGGGDIGDGGSSGSTSDAGGSGGGATDGGGGDASVDPDAGDASVVPDASVDGSMSVDASTDADDLTCSDLIDAGTCVDCIARNCCLEFIICELDPPCFAADGGPGEFECILDCLANLGDAGAPDSIAVDACAGFCAGDGGMTQQEAIDMSMCIVGAGDGGANCQAECI